MQFKDGKLLLVTYIDHPIILVKILIFFINEFNDTLLEFYANNQNTYLCGDYNVDLLKINSIQAHEEYFDNILSSGYVPTILGQNPPGQNLPDKTPRSIPPWTKPPGGQNPPVDKTP